MKNTSFSLYKRLLCFDFSRLSLNLDLSVQDLHLKYYHGYLVKALYLLGYRPIRSY